MRNTPSINIEEDEIICKCFHITESTIRSHIAKNNITQVKDITLACEAGGNCGSCHILIQLFIDQNKPIKILEQSSKQENLKSKNNKKGFWKNLLINSYINPED